MVGRRGVGRCSLLAALPLAPQVPGRLSAGGFILDDLESARAKALLGTRARRAAVGPRHRLQQPDARGRHARLRSRPRRRGPDIAEAPARRPGRLAPRCRRARSRPTATRPTTSSSSTCRPTTRPRRCRSCASACTRRPGLDVELAGGPAFYGDVQTVSRGGPPPQRAHLAAARRAGAARRLRLGSSRPASRWSSAVPRSSSRSPRSSWSPRSSR